MGAVSIEPGCCCIIIICCGCCPYAVGMGAMVEPVAALDDDPVSPFWCRSMDSWISSFVMPFCSRNDTRSDSGVVYSNNSNNTHVRMVILCGTVTHVLLIQLKRGKHQTQAPRLEIVMSTHLHVRVPQELDAVLHHFFPHGRFVLLLWFVAVEIRKCVDSIISAEERDSTASARIYKAR